MSGPTDPALCGTGAQLVQVGHQGSGPTGSAGGDQQALVDTRRLESSFAAIDFFEKRGIPFVAAVNNFEGQQRYSAEQIRSALALDPALPVRMFDARDRGACRDVLLTLVDHVLAAVSDPLPTAH